MARYAILVLPLTLAAGCGTSLNLVVERYDLDAVKGARAAFRAAQPTMQTTRSIQQLAAFRAAVERYRCHVKSLDHIVQPLMAAGPVRTRDAQLDRLFEPLLSAIDSEKARLQALAAAGPESAQCASESPVDPKVAALWGALPALLEGAHVETNAARIEKVIGQVSGVAGLAERVNSARASLVDLAKAGACPDGAQIKELADSLAKGNLKEVALGEQAQLAAARVEAKSRVGMLAEESREEIRRDHIVMQNMADPFIAFIASHDDGWRKVGNEARVNGDGDTEFILAFEQNLDGRWKSITVDPSKVIRARLRIARSIGTAMAAIGGMVAAGFGVPVPASLLTANTGQPATPDASKPAEGNSLDFSQLTGEEQLLRKRNERLRSALLQLRAFALAAQRDLSDKNVDPNEVRLQLLRRLQAFPDLQTTASKE